MKALFLYIWNQSRLLFASTSALAGLTAVTSVLVVKNAKTLIESHESMQLATVALVIVYALLCIFGNFSTQLLITLLGRRAEYGLRATFSQQVLRLPHPVVELQGGRLSETIFRETRFLATTLNLLFRSGRNILVLIGLIGYAFYLSPLITGAVIFGRILFEGIARKIDRRFKATLVRERASRHKVRELLALLWSGHKELIQNSDLRENYSETELLPALRRNRDQSIRIEMIKNGLATATASLILIMGVTLVYFAFSRGTLTMEVAAALLMIFAMARTQVSNVTNTMAKVQDIQVALQQLSQYGLNIDEINREIERIPTSFFGTEVEQLELQDVWYSHGRTTGSESFMMGPISLKITGPGLYFLVGENGSGKSTLARILCGLYKPDSGRVLCNGDSVSEETLSSYREQFATVFSQFQLFPGYLREHSQQHRPLSRELGIETFLERPTYQNLEQISTGQKKRVALFQALIENRPVLVLDEWSADQDPEYCDYFYYTLLPRLKGAGKIVILITHQMDYCDIADQIFTMKDGRCQIAALTFQE